MPIRMHIGTRDKLMLLAVLATVTVSPLFARRMTVAQLQQLMDDAKGAHRTDDFVVRKLAGVKLTNRLCPTTLQTLVAESPGPRSAQALHFLSDASVFLDPPANEIPGLPAPDLAAQRAMIQQSIHYVARVLPTLPNFTATRVTEQLVDSPQGLDPLTIELLGDLYLVNTFRATVSYRDGKETEEPNRVETTADSSTQGNVRKDAVVRIPSPWGLGLTTNGEFGPMLASTLLDASKGTVTWARWEDVGGKRAAVFHFTVDRSVSHFKVNSWEPPEAEVVGNRLDMVRGMNGTPGTPMGMIDTDAAHAKSQPAAYHGQLVVDPDSGTILRIAVEAEPPHGQEWKQAAILVEYGPVQIGDNTYFCPIHGVAISTTMEANHMISTVAFQSTELHVNHVEFTGYHRFGSESTLITSPPPAAAQQNVSTQTAQGGQPAQIGQPSQPNPAGQEGRSSQAASSVAPAAETSSAPSNSPPASASPEAPSTAAASPAAAPQEIASAEPAPPAPAVSQPSAEGVSMSAEDEEILVRAADGLPGTAAHPADGAASNTASGGTESATFTLKVTSRLVDLGLIATDKHGKPIADLRQDEVEVYDNGRKQQLADFHRAVPGAAPQSSQPGEAKSTFTNAAPATAPAAAAPDLLIFLIDESGLAYADLNRARGDVLHFLKTTHSAFRVALYSVGRHGFRVIQDVTPDRAVALASLEAWTPSAPAVPAGQESQRNRQQFDAVRSTKDLNTLGATPSDAPGSFQTADSGLRPMGANPLRPALEGMIALARHLASVPGHKSLIWISGDRALTAMEEQAADLAKGDPSQVAALLHTDEVLNEAQIALYALDASAVEGGAVNAARASREEMNPSTTEAGQRPGGSTAPPAGAGRARSSADSSAPERVLLQSVRQLTESTGGRAVNKGGELENDLEAIAKDSASVYEVGFHPDQPADGKFHTLQVRIPDRKDVKLRYRSGYIFNELPDDTQQRFQQAVWSPQDATAIPLTVESVPASDSAPGHAAVQLHISLSGLALEQKAGRWTDQVYVFLAQRDDATQQAQLFGETMHLALKQATYESGMPQGIPYRHEFEAQSKLGSLRILVVDGNSGKIGSVTVPSPSPALHP